MKSGDLVGGKYRLEKLLGEGAMGTVWAARNERTDKAFAVKLMLPQYARDATLVQRFFVEARVCGRLEHPSLVDIYDLGLADELDGAPFLVMELLRGEGLDTLLTRVGNLDPRTVATVLLKVVAALELAHEAGIVHRDIKPANIFLHRSPRGELTPKILDFGVSKTMGTGADVGLTHAGMLVGTPLYMSPEQARGQNDIDARSDVWSLGVILYQSIAGVVPFRGSNYNAVLSAILTQRHVPLRERRKGVLPLLSETVDRCLIKNRERRTGSARELAERLEKVLIAYETLDTSSLPSDPSPFKTGNALPSLIAALDEEEDDDIAGSDESTEVMDERVFLASLERDPAPHAAHRPDKDAPRSLRTTGAVPRPSSHPPLPSRPPAADSLSLRRLWVAELAAAVRTTKTDDIDDVAEPAQDVARANRAAAETVARNATLAVAGGAPPGPLARPALSPEAIAAFEEPTLDLPTRLFENHALSAKRAALAAAGSPGDAPAEPPGAHPTKPAERGASQSGARASVSRQAADAIAPPARPATKAAALPAPPRAAARGPSPLPVPRARRGPGRAQRGWALVGRSWKSPRALMMVVLVLVGVALGFVVTLLRH